MKHANEFALPLDTQRAKLVLTRRQRLEHHANRGIYPG